MKIMKKISEILVICCFAIFLVVCAAVTAANYQDDYSYYENRSYHEAPEVVGWNIMGGWFFDQLEDFLCDRAAGRELLLKAKTYVDFNVLHRPVVNEVVAGRDGVLLDYLSYAKVDADEISDKAEQVASEQQKLSDMVEGYGGQYYYVAVPCQYVCYEDYYPSFLNNKKEFTELEINSLSTAMQEKNVNFTDMRPIYEADETLVDGDELLYTSKVDNHYSLRGAYALYRELINEINADTDYELYFPEGDEISFTRLNEPYMGSRTRKLMGAVTTDEHLLRADLTSPVAFTRTDNGKKVKSEVYRINAMDDGKLTYSYYMGGDIAETIIDTERPELPSVMIYGDSFTNALECLIYNSFDKMYSIDMRQYNVMSVADYVEYYKPDIVICVRDYQSLLSLEGNGAVFEIVH